MGAYKLNVYGPKHKKPLMILIGMRAKSLKGLLWMWAHLPEIGKQTAESPGCLTAIAGLSGPHRIIMVSYWEDHEKLLAFVHAKKHNNWISYVQTNPEDFDLFNETYEKLSKSQVLNKGFGYSLAYGYEEEGAHE